MIMLLVSSESL